MVLSTNAKIGDPRRSSKVYDEIAGRKKRRAMLAARGDGYSY